MKQSLKVMISGGGTGGHIFPAIAIADAIRRKEPNAEIRFVGAKGRMEMHRVPDAGYPIDGLPICGFDRKNLLKNVLVLFKIFRSQLIARRIIKQFRPDVVVGVGGYASGPTLKVANMMGIPTLLQEQNSYAGVTNKLLAKKAHKICVAYEGMERFFEKDKLLLTGNPVREQLMHPALSRDEALSSFQLAPRKRTILLVGGSLGARTLNNCMMQHLTYIRQSNVQFIWQCGKLYEAEAKAAYEKAGRPSNVYLTPFISDMSKAYAAADLVISRAGAGSISEFCLLEKPVILVPSPNVAEDHQTKNAMALSEKGAAHLVTDAEAPEKLIKKAIEIVNDVDKLAGLSQQIAQLAQKDSDSRIADQVIQLAAVNKK
jgi:UDP-N-acetylglucosamine--N-acetylmuramyl-(pentapeptide) pyrophosphoryl-undecaprenol N-acetylglucosamine transferase